MNRQYACKLSAKQWLYGVTISLCTSQAYCQSLHTPFYDQQLLVASDSAAFDYFGRDVSVSGSTIVAGAFKDDDQGADSGSAYIFEQQLDGTWQQTAKLLASDGSANDRFGYTVSIAGDTVVVGAFGDSDNGINAGSAFVFEKQIDESWLQTAKLLASDGSANDQFGRDVCISSNKIVVGASGDINKGIHSGSAYTFVRQKDSTWMQTAKLLATDGASEDYFGRGVSIVNSTIAIGAYGTDDNGTNSGSVYLFEEQLDGSWIQVTKLLASDGGIGDYLGFNVDIVESTVVAGAYQDDGNGASSGSAYIFKKVSGIWSQHTKLLASDGAGGDYFGLNVSVSGPTVVIGAYRVDDLGPNSGSAYIFEEQPDGSWNQETKLHASNGVANDWFGISVSISNDIVAIGAFLHEESTTDQGSVYIYKAGCTSDINADGLVNIEDLLLLVSNWGCSGVCTGDTNANGIVDLSDLLQVIADFGGAC